MAITAEVGPASFVPCFGPLWLLLALEDSDVQTVVDEVNRRNWLSVHVVGGLTESLRYRLWLFLAFLNVVRSLSGTIVDMVLEFRVKG